MPQVAGGCEEAGEFFLAVDLGELARVLAAHAQIKARLAEHVAIEERERGGIHVTGALSPLAFHEQMMEVGADLFAAESVRRASIETGQADDGTNIVCHRPW